MAQLLFNVADRQASLKEDLLVDLLPARSGSSVELVCRPDGKEVVVGFPFEGRILNRGKAAASIEGWDLEGVNEGPRRDSSSTFQGATAILSPQVEGGALAGRGDVEIVFPQVLSPGQTLRFETLLRVRIVEFPLVSVLVGLAGESGTASLSPGDLAKALPGFVDLCGNRSLQALGTGEDDACCIRVRFRSWTDKGHSFGYEFLWAPPSRIEQGHVSSGARPRIHENGGAQVTGELPQAIWPLLQVVSQGLG